MTTIAAEFLTATVQMFTVTHLQLRTLLIWIKREVLFIPAIIFIIL